MKTKVVYVAVSSHNDFFLEDLNGSPEEHCLLATLAAASQERKDEDIKLWGIWNYFR